MRIEPPGGLPPSRQTVDFVSREVLIPMVGTSSLGALARIATDDKLSDPHQAQLDRRLSGLLQSGLYSAGEQAQAAVRLLRWSRHRWLARGLRYVTQDDALHVVNPGDIRGLGPENSASAELGLALVQLMFRAQTSEMRILATGALDLNRLDSDAPVRPVHHLGRKLQLVLQHFAQPGSAQPPRWFLTPCTDPDGTAVADRYAAQIEGLRARGIEWRCVTTVGEAARLLGAHCMATTRRERQVRWLLGVICLAAITSALVNVWLNAPIGLGFAPIARSDHTLLATPVRIRTQGSTTQLLEPCALNDERLAAFPIGEQLGMWLHVKAVRPPLSGTYHLALVSVSASSGAKVLPLPGPQTIAAGMDAGYRIDVRAPQEETLLVWLARRGRSFDSAELDAKLRRLLASVQPSERIGAARSFLQHAAPGVLTYDFRSVSPAQCP